MDEKFQALHSYIKSMSDLPDEEWEAFLPNIKLEEFKKGTLLVEPGETKYKIFVVSSGVIRIYYLDEEGKEYTKMFQGPFGFMGPYSEALEGIPTQVYMQAVTDTELFYFDYQTSRDFLKRHVSWQIISRMVAEQLYVKKEKREYSLLKMSALERYQEFLNDFKDIHQQIPQYQVASYLGIAPESFNRLLKKSVT